MIELKQSTAGQVVSVGQALDITDGNTEEASLTIANTDIKLHKWGTTTLANKNSGGATYISNGVYYLTLDATDTNTLGPMTLYIHVAGALVMKETFDVVTANWWDTKHSTDQLDVNVTNVAGTSQTGNDNGADINTILSRVTAAVATEAKQDIIDANVDTILADTNELQTNQGDWTTATGFATEAKQDIIDTNVDSILVDTGTTIPAQITARSLATADYFDPSSDQVTVQTNNDKEDYTLSVTGIAEILDSLVEGTTTLAHALQDILAATTGKMAGGGTSTITARDVADTKNRLTVTVDANGNRTAVTRSHD